MIVVTGTKRSGTSMWMQILKEGGIEPIGEQFPLDWGTRLRDLNPGGFYESRLRNGINFTTNPDPLTGFYLAPHECARSATKIFIAGLICTDLAYLGRVIATMRDWRSYTESRGRLEAIDLAEGVSEDVRFAARYNVPAPLEWWIENYALLRDAMTRRYPFTIFSYESIAAGDRELVQGTFDWIGFGDADAAMQAIVDRPGAEVPQVESGVAPEHEATFDELYRRVHEGGAMDQEFIEQLDDTHERLLPRITEHVHESNAALLRLRAEGAGSEALRLGRAEDG